MRVHFIPNCGFMQHHKHSFFFLPVFLVFVSFSAFSQVVVEGYVYESNNAGFIENATVTLYSIPDNKEIGTFNSGPFGHFSTSLPAGQYRMVTRKDIFEDREDTFKVENTKIFLKVVLNRQPGYLLNAQLVEIAPGNTNQIDVQDVTVEVYNRTRDQAETVQHLKTTSVFQQRFDQGNRYLVMLRKPGYLGRRIEVYINNNGCALCLEGLPDYTKGDKIQQIGSNKVIPLSAPVILERSVVGKHIPVPYYKDDQKSEKKAESDSQEKELDKIVTLLRDNPDVSFEIGFHTDSRGDDSSNLELSQKQADAARNYIINGGVEPERISAKGYGETQLRNKCANGVSCTEEEHLQNRRVELTITSVSQEPYAWLSIEQVIEEEKIAARAQSEQNSVKNVPKPSRIKNKPLPEANNSVPLPEFQGNNKVDGSNQPGSPARSMDKSQSRQVNIVPLDGAYAGYAVQIYTTPNELNALPKNLRSFSEIFWRQEGEGAWYYYIIPAGTDSDIKKYYKKTIKPEHPDAILVRFGPKGKEIIK